MNYRGQTSVDQRASVCAWRDVIRDWVLAAGRTPFSSSCFMSSSRKQNIWRLADRRPTLPYWDDSRNATAAMTSLSSALKAEAEAQSTSIQPVTHRFEASATYWSSFHSLLCYVVVAEVKYLATHRSTAHVAALGRQLRCDDNDNLEAEARELGSTGI